MFGVCRFWFDKINNSQNIDNRHRFVYNKHMQMMIIYLVDSNIISYPTNKFPPKKNTTDKLYRTYINIEHSYHKSSLSETTPVDQSLMVLSVTLAVLEIHGWFTVYFHHVFCRKCPLKKTTWIMLFFCR